MLLLLLLPLLLIELVVVMVVRLVESGIHSGTGVAAARRFVGVGAATDAADAAAAASGRFLWQRHQRQVAQCCVIAC